MKILTFSGVGSDTKNLDYIPQYLSFDNIAVVDNLQIVAGGGTTIINISDNARLQAYVNQGKLNTSAIAAVALANGVITNQNCVINITVSGATGVYAGSKNKGSFHYTINEQRVQANSSITLSDFVSVALSGSTDTDLIITQGKNFSGQLQVGELKAINQYDQNNVSPTIFGADYEIVTYTPIADRTIVVAKYAI